MADSIAEIEDIPPDLLRHQFEEIVILTFKEIANTIHNLKDRIQALEKDKLG